MTHQQQRLGSCWPQASVLRPMECQLHEVVQPSMIWQTVVQPAIRHQVQSAIRQEKTQWEEFVQAMRVNEDLFLSCTAKVDNENKCVESEKLNSQETQIIRYKIQLANPKTETNVEKNIALKSLMKKKLQQLRRKMLKSA
ncbi:hypothetical protein PVAP13_6KG262000 [Panicum virgatum]|uniref:Uncharacterized protein n=1 Tax=Panicum virgatum TaxID=38727 RepID=A0A8T0RCF7_PANVG|nr:hypothetical protein PVAP13_6KG262000 [Panicum virgatum]